MNGSHDLSLLGGYSLGILDDDERRMLDAHLAGCESCRAELAQLQETVGLLATVPRELVLPAQVGADDLVLRRTLRAARAESPLGRRRRTAAVAACVAALVALSGTAGVVLGRRTDTTPVDSAKPAVAGTINLQATDPRTGATMKAAVIPAADWVRLKVDIGGIAEGKRCRLVVVTRAGVREIAGSWIVSKRGAEQGIPIDGGVAVGIGDVASVEVETLDGELLVAAPT